jgi:hypothetical protein
MKAMTLPYLRHMEPAVQSACLLEVLGPSFVPTFRSMRAMKTLMGKLLPNRLQRWAKLKQQYSKYALLERLNCRMIHPSYV